jgi:hypothetical protein
MSAGGEQSDAAGGAWERVLESLCRLQRLLPDAVLVGGTASALYAGHRLSFDHDHVVTDLRQRFDDVLADLEAVAGWRTARVTRPVLILGSLDGVETGVRQLRRTRPLETTVMRVGNHEVLLTPLAETLRIKAFLYLERDTRRITSTSQRWGRIWGSKPQSTRCGSWMNSIRKTAAILGRYAHSL